MNVNRSKTKYLCINGGNDDETVKMEDTKVPRVKEFKYLGSTVPISTSYRFVVLSTGMIMFCEDFNDAMSFIKCF